MSLRLKRVGKALRARYGVAEGVRPESSGIVCGREVGDGAFCARRAHVKSAGTPLCREHLAQERKPRRR